MHRRKITYIINLKKNEPLIIRAYSSIFKMSTELILKDVNALNFELNV